MDRSVAKTALADVKGRLVFITNSSVDGFFDDAVDDIMIGPYNEVCRILGSDDGAVIVVEETEVPGIVSNAVVEGGAGVCWIYIRVWIRHGILVTVHEDADICHVGGCRVWMVMTFKIH